MNRVAFILDGSCLQDLANFFAIDETELISKERRVKMALADWLASEAGLCHGNGFIEYSTWQRPDKGYNIDGTNYFISCHLIHFLYKKNGSGKDNYKQNLPQGLKKWLSYCELILLERSLFQFSYDRSDETFLMKEYIIEGKTLLIFGGKPELYENNLCLDDNLILWKDSQPGLVISEQIKDAFRQKGLPVLVEKRRAASAYLLCVDDKPEELDRLEAIFREFYKEQEDIFFHGVVYNNDIDIKEKIKELLGNWNQAKPFVVLLDVYLSPDIHGDIVLDLLKELRDEFPWLSFLLFSGAKTQEDVRGYAHESGIKYLEKPTSPKAASFKKNFDVLLDESRAATKAYFTAKGLETLISEPAQYSGMTYAIHGVFAKIIEKIKIIAPSDMTVLVTGESGTGKEGVAQAIHRISRSSTGAFAALNCGALPGPLLESELFGHKKGAFTGADVDKDGYFAEAENGTLFLDEIGDTSLAMQVKLLRVLQERAYVPLGANKPVKTNVRIIAATHKDLLEMVTEGSFREDLYYRLKVLEIHLPPLKERREDIPLIIDNHLTKKKITFTKESKLLLTACEWPGNVRQLLNFIDKICISLNANDTVTVDKLVEFGLAGESELDHALVEHLKFKEQKRQNALATSCKISNKKWDSFIIDRIAAIAESFSKRETVQKILSILCCKSDIDAALESDEDCQKLLDCICDYTASSNKKDWPELRRVFGTPPITETISNLPNDGSIAIDKFKKRLFAENRVLNKEWKRINGRYPSEIKRTFFFHVFIGAAHNECYKKFAAGQSCEFHSS